MPDLETAIGEAVERAVRKALAEALPIRSTGAIPNSSDDEVLGVPALAEYLGIGTRQAYGLVNANPPQFPVKRVGNRILVLKGAVRHWLEAGGQAALPAMSFETRQKLSLPRSR
jgi:predicted DNA-binding transcriptional regulator AlpA